MKIKKFTAKTFSEALAMVKKELSQDAVILKTEEKKGFRPQVEVTAAVDFEAEGSVRNADCQLRNESLGSQSEIRNQKSEIASASYPRFAPFSATIADDNAVDQLKGEVGALRAMIESMKNNGYEMSLPPKKRAVLNFLRERAVNEAFALRLCDKTSELSDIPLLLSSDIKIKRHTGTRKAVMLIGPTGVGKTTTIAKLAARAVRAGKRTAVINLDTYRIGAAEQSRIYARILGIPLTVATNVEEFRSALAGMSESRDVVFIDTTGRNPKDESAISDLASFCKVETPLELHLLMSANNDDACMIEAYRSYRELPIDYLAFTKIDEAVRFGPIYNLMLVYQKPVAYITTGQQVPGDLEYASVSRLAGLIVNRESGLC
jgi:flagellar biosynthesis protein FlhF